MSTINIDDMFERLRKSVEKDSGVAVHKGNSLLDLASSVPFYLPTGIPQLDAIIRGGWPAGKIIELYGFEKSGKTAASLHAMGECTSRGGICLFVDTERSWDAERAANAGINLDRVLVAETPTIEATFRTIESFIEDCQPATKDFPVLVVVDSITGATTEDELSNTLSSEMRIGQEAKQIRRGIRRVGWQLADKHVTAIFVNHAVSKIAAWGKASQSAGGHALKFMSTIRIEFKDIGKVLDPKDKTILQGQKIMMEIEKLKGASLKQFKIEVVLRNGLYDSIESLLEAAIQTGMVEHPHRSKSYYLFKDTELEREFPRSDWPAIVEELGGFSTVYQMWLDDALEKGEIQPWSL